MSTSFIHTRTQMPDLIALGAAASAQLGRAVSVNWRSQQTVDGKLVSGALEFLDEQGNRLDVSDATFASLLNNSVSEVTPKQKIQAALAGANNVAQIKAVVGQLIDQLMPQ